MVRSQKKKKKKNLICRKVTCTAPQFSALCVQRQQNTESCPDRIYFTHTKRELLKQFSLVSFSKLGLFFKDSPIMKKDTTLHFILVDLSVVVFFWLFFFFFFLFCFVLFANSFPYAHA